MSSRCRFCGGKITSDAASCEHCGKQLRKTESVDEPRSITNIESWKERSIPSWLMYLVVGFFLACFVIMFLDAGTDPKPAQPPNDPAQRNQPVDQTPSEREAPAAPR